MSVLAEASLTPAERRTVERLVKLLEREFAPDLRAVWLFGSRARGEPPAEESDIDLLVLTTGGWERDDRRVIRLLHEAADAEGTAAPYFSAHVRSPAWVGERRAIEDFFIPRGRSRQDRPIRLAMSPRSAEFLAAAQRRLRTARASLEVDDPSGAASAAYYAILYAARAALSEEDRYVTGVGDLIG